MHGRALLLLPAVLLLSATVGCTTARAQQQGASPAASTPSAQPAQVRPARSYTGLRIGGSASTTPGGTLAVAHPVVRLVQPDSPGQRAGVLEGDVIIDVNGRDSREQGALWMAPGVSYTLRLRRGDQELEAVVVPLPPQPAPATPSS